jgi:RNA polymerase sigma-70 factor (ECF subfamily)
LGSSVIVVNELARPDVDTIMMLEEKMRVRLIPSASESSYEAFFRSAFPRIRAAAARIVGPQGGEDLAIEALARAYARWPTVERMEHPQAWVTRVAVNLALDQVRRKALVFPSLSLRDESDQVVLRADLVKVLRLLPKRQREVVVLRHVVDLSEAEVARILGISEGSVKTHLHRAVTALRSALSDEERPSP